MYIIYRYNKTVCIRVQSIHGILSFYNYTLVKISMVNCGYFLIYSYSAIKVLEKPIDYVCTCTSILKCVCI